jgi:hypothetical protein
MRPRERSCISSRAVRVARALVLVSTGCSSPAQNEVGSADAAATVDASTPETLTVADSSVAESAPVVDAHPDAMTHADAVAESGAVDARVHTPLTCEEQEYTVACSAGKVCGVSITDGIVRCTDPAGGVLKACGSLSCGWMCACADPANSICACYSDAGPLPPPDLPA